jgi:hypothetical protein
MLFRIPPSKLLINKILLDSHTPDDLVVRT